TFELVLGGLNWWLYSAGQCCTVSIQYWPAMYSANSVPDSNVRHCMESIWCSTAPARGVLCSCTVSAFSFV
ncbi:hypothetical protein DFJ43DRAFT_1102396, partial [Lentinula guzmanii]